MLKRFVWKENQLYTIQLKNDCYIIAQLLKKPYAAFFKIKSKHDFNKVKENIDLNSSDPLIVTMVLKQFFKLASSGRITNKNILPRKNINIPTLFVSKDKEQFFEVVKTEDVIYNIVKIDPSIGDRGRMNNEIVEYNIDYKNNSFDEYEITGYNTGYEFIRRLLLSLEYEKSIDPLKEVWFYGKDSYPYPTVKDMWEMGVPKYKL